MHRPSKVPSIDYCLHPAYGGLLGRPAFVEKLRVLYRACTLGAKVFKDCLKYNLRSGRLVLSSSPFKSDLSTLEVDGVVTFRVPLDTIDSIRESANHWIRMLEERPVKHKFIDKVIKIRKREAAAFYAQIQKLLESYRIFEIASQYRRYPVEITAVFLQIDSSTDTDHKNLFGSVCPDPPTAYMHVDSSVKWMKCILYLSHVDADNGPFSYVLGSNQLEDSVINYIARRAVSKLGIEWCDTESRQKFWALPRLFQKKTHFGNDLLASSPEAEWLLNSERKLTSKDGNLFLFDSDGIHRGGMVKEGKRCILQIALKPSWKNPSH